MSFTFCIQSREEQTTKMALNGSTWDCVVVGAGIVGSCTALQMAKLGHKTLLLDQVTIKDTSQDKK